MKTCKLILIFIVLLSVNLCYSQDVLKLWEGQEKPFYKENDLKEFEEEVWGTIVHNDIIEPTLTVYKAEGENSGKAVIIIPGGGYSVVAIHHEGYDLAEVLAKNGITAAVLKYRLPKTESSDMPEMVPLTDARKALKLLRSKAEKYEIDINKVGVLGFSAGSHLSTVLSLWESDDSTENPDYSALIYGVTRLTKENQKWLEESLYHRKLNDEEITKNTLLNLVNEDTPPAFLIHAYDDDVCNLKESTLYAEKLFEHNVPVEMHLFPTGGHGFGMGRETGGTSQWVDLFVTWVKLLD